jgi:TadE-like protein
MRKPIKKLLWIRRFQKEERGSQILELAIALPAMLLILGAIAEFGRFFYTYTTLTNQVRAGARHACKWEKNAPWTIPEVTNLVVTGDFGSGGTPVLPGLSAANVQVDANGPGVNAIDSVTVRIKNYKYQPFFDLGALTGISSLSLNIDMNASATMHQLYNGPTAGS